MATTFTVEVDWEHAGTWTDETAYVQRVRIFAGFERDGDAVATPGRCEIVLDNNTRRFSPAYTAGALYGKLLPRRPLRIKAVSGGSTWTLFQGFIETIAPDAGEYGARRCVLTGVDGLALLARQRVGVAYAAAKAVDDAVSELVTAAYTPPAASYADNGDTLEHYGQHWQPEYTTCLDALREVAEAVYGRFFVTRDGTVTFRTRQQLQDPSVAAALTLSDDAVDGLEMRLEVGSVINLCQVKIYPAETIGSTQELWRAHTTLRLAPGQTRTVYAPFRDYATGARCGAVDVITPVPTADYTINTKNDGSGTDVTGSGLVTLTCTSEATRMKIVLASAAVVPLYVTLLKVRGKAIRTYDPIICQASDSASQAAYQKRARVFDLPMQADPNFAETMADYIVGRFKDPALACSAVIVRGQDTIGGVNVFSIGLLDKVVISDSQTGASALGHWVRAVEYDLNGGAARVTLHLERADDRRYWLLGKSGYGELGMATRLGF